MRLNVAALLAVLSVAAWALAIVPLGSSPTGDEFVLLDASQSCGGTTAARAWLEREGVPTTSAFLFGATPVEGDPLYSANDLRGDPPAYASDLGAALAAIRPRLEAGDRLRIVTDGRVTDTLPRYAGWESIGVEWVPADWHLRIARFDLPATWPEGATLDCTLEFAEPPVGEVTLQIDASPPDAIESWDARQISDRRWQVSLQRGDSDATVARLSVTAQDASGADRREATISLHWLVHWQTVPEADASTAPGAAFDEVATADLEKVRTLLAAGWVVVLNSGERDEWAQLPADLRVLEPMPPAAPTVVVLLDRSGSMEGGPLDEARQVITQWASVYGDSVGWAVIPFAAECDPPLDPREPAQAAQLQSLSAFGPTRLADCLVEVARVPASESLLLILSDGEAEEPDDGWQALAAQVQSSFADVRVVPVSDRAQLDVLDALGSRADGAEFAQRFSNALADAEPYTRETARVVEPTLWSIPPSLDGGRRARVQAGEQARAFMQTRRGSVALAGRAIGTGLLVGVAAELEPAVWLDPLAAEFLDSPRWERSASAVLARGDATGWVARQGQRESPMRQAGPAVWRAAGLDASAVELVPPDGGVPFTLPAWRPGEWKADVRPFLAWATGREPSQDAPWRPIFLLLGLGLAVTSLGWARFARAA